MGIELVQGSTEKEVFLRPEVLFCPLLQGEPGSPMMCQVKRLDLWILRGLLAYGGVTCPGVFLYTSVEDYSDWITAKTGKPGLSLSSLPFWENLISELPFHESSIALTKNSSSVHSYTDWTHSYSQGQRMSTTYNKQKDAGQNFRVNEQSERGGSSKVAIQPMYYDYYGGEVGEDGAGSGQNRLHWSQERILMSFVLVFLGSGV